MNSKSAVASLLIFEIMTSEPYAVTERDIVRSVIEAFISKKISGAPLVDSAKKVISVVSEADLMKFAALGGIDEPLAKFRNKLTPTADLVTVKADESFAEVFKRFLTKPVRRVIVVDVDFKLVGIVSRRDIIKAFLKTEKKA